MFRMKQKMLTEFSISVSKVVIKTHLIGFFYSRGANCLEPPLTIWVCLCRRPNYNVDYTKYVKRLG